MAAPKFDPHAWPDAPPLPSLSGPWAPNNALAGAQHLTFNGTVLAPESLAADGETVYASVAYGAVLRLPADTLQPGVPVFFTPAAIQPGGFSGPPGAHPLFAYCVAQTIAMNFSAEADCGRPLGLRVHAGSLYVVDASFGIFRVPLGHDSAAAEWLVKPNDVTPPLRFMNDLAVDGDGAIYFTDSSSNSNRAQNILVMLNNPPDGRFLRKRTPDAPTETLAAGLHFPNGVEITNGTTLVVELGRLRVLACDLPVTPGATCALRPFTTTPLPGVADNIRLSAAGDELLIGAGAKIAKPASLIYVFWTNPTLGRILYALINAIPAVESRVRSLVMRYGLVLRLNLDGSPRGSWHDPSGGTPGISQATQVGGYLWLGSSVNPYVARVPMAQLGA